MLWLRSDLGIAAGATTVGTWPDQSGNGADASSAGTHLPNYSLTGTNGLPRVTPGASTSFMEGTFASSINAHTFFGVVTYPTVTNSAAFAATNSLFQVNTGFSQFQQITPNVLIGRVVGADASTTFVSSTGLTSIYSTAAPAAPGGGGAVDLQVNGVTLASTTLVGSPAASAKYLLFGLDNTPQYPLAGDSYEYIVYNRVLSAGERQRVHRYLGGRYGIAVP